MMHVREADQGSGPQRSRCRTGGRHRSFQPQPSFFIQAALGPEPEQRSCELHASVVAFRSAQSPVERRADVVLLHADAPETGQLVVVAQHRQRATKFLEEELEMPAAELLGFSAVHEAFARELPDRFEEAIAALAGGAVIDDHERLADQFRQQIEHVARVDAAAAAHVFSRLERPRRRKDRQPVQHQPLGVRQQLTAPVHRRLERSLPGHGGAGAASEQPEPVVQAGFDLLGREHHHPSGRQLDRQGNAVETAADTRDRVRVGRGGPEIRIHRPCPIDEEPGGVRLDGSRRPCAGRSGTASDPTR